MSDGAIYVRSYNYEMDDGFPALVREVGKHREDNWPNPLRVIDLLTKYGTVANLCAFSRTLILKPPGRHSEERTHARGYWRSKGIRPWIELDS